MLEIDLYDLRDIIESEGDFDYVESEGSDCLRVDRDDDSAWVYSSGEFDGNPTLIRELKRFTKQLI